MGSERAPQAVFVVNASDDVVEMLRIILEQAGFAVVSMHVDDIKRGSTDFEQFVRQHSPSAVVYDVPPPYDRQWQFLQHLRARPYVKDVPFVLTTTNVAQLRRAVGTDEPLCEIVGKPYDLEKIVEAVQQAVG
jgi:CheY-like chemotaxis protein